MQNMFLPWYYSNRPDSSEDTPENSSPRSFSVIGSLLNGNDMSIEKRNIMFVCSLYRSLREKNCTKPDVFLNVLKHYMLSPRLSKSYYLFFIFDCMFIDNLNRKHNIKGAKCAKRTLLYNGCVLFSLSIFNCVHYSNSAIIIS